MRKILPSITTIGLTNNSWHDKIQQLKNLGLVEVGLFLTGLDAEQRTTCLTTLKALTQEHSFRIPFVHAVSDMREEEFEFLIQNFDTKYFNLHPQWEFPLQHVLSSEIRKYILIENSASWAGLTAKDVEGFAGLCLDLSHLEDARRSVPEAFEKTIALATRVPVLANHISAVGAHPNHFHNDVPMYSTHDLTTGSMDYLKNLPSYTFAQYCAIELENDLETQHGLIDEIRSNLENCHLALAA